MSPDRPAAAMSSPLAAVDRFPRVRLGHAPTPLDPAPQLGAALGIELWIKRADTVLVTGAVQSNLVRLAAVSPV